MRFSSRLGTTCVAALLALSTASIAHADGNQTAATNPSGADPEAPFLADNDAAMSKMMQGMAVQPTGDIDRDFALMMIPHHQGAIDMAEAELRYGSNETLRRIAQEIIVDQLQEIAVMRLAIGDPPPPSAPAPTVAP